MTRFIRLLAPILAALLLASAALADIVAIPPGTTLIALRHADRTGEDLNAKGHRPRRRPARSPGRCADPRDLLSGL